jgi:hypothetical protein
LYIESFRSTLKAHQAVAQRRLLAFQSHRDPVTYQKCCILNCDSNDSTYMRRLGSSRADAIRSASVRPPFATDVKITLQSCTWTRLAIQVCKRPRVQLGRLQSCTLGPPCSRVLQAATGTTRKAPIQYPGPALQRSYAISRGYKSG